MDLIDLGQANLNISDTLMINNTNNLFSLISSFFSLVNSTIMNQICFTTLTGCLLSGIEYSIIMIIFSKFENISSEIQEGNIYIENSNLNMSLSNMNFLKTKKKQGDCISVYGSLLNSYYSNFSNYHYNCLFLVQSQINILGSKFNNSGFSDKFIEYNNFGTLYCLQCQNLVISESYFIENNHVIDGSALYAVSKKGDILKNITIKNSYFYGNQALEKGTIYIYNQNFSIEFSDFQNNFAKRGAGIFVDNDGRSQF